MGKSLKQEARRRKCLPFRGVLFDHGDRKVASAETLAESADPIYPVWQHNIVI